MKIGDKVNFLSETGGGVIAGFKGNNIALVEDEDGFQIPTPLSDLVLSSDSGDYSTSKVVASKSQQAAAEPDDAGFNKSVKAKINAFDADEEEPEDSDPADGDITFTPLVEERKGGNVLNVYLAFVPDDIKNLSKSKFNCYVVNDSNYYLRYAYLSVEGSACTLRSEDEIEPNTKVFIEDFGYEQLNELDKVAFQLLAFKRDKQFVKKPVVDVALKIDKVKFYKLHAFQENDFFESPALLYPIVENDSQEQETAVDAEALQNGMASAKATEPSRQSAAAHNQYKSDGYVRRYDNGKSGNPFVGKHKDDILVVDLHADELLDTTAGMGAADILNYQMDVFRKTLESQKGNKGKKIVFIHGKGEGVLRHAIVNELRYRYKKYRYQDASFQEYGYGATQVTIM